MTIEQLSSEKDPAGNVRVVVVAVQRAYSEGLDRAQYRYLPHQGAASAGGQRYLVILSVHVV